MSVMSSGKPQGTVDPADIARFERLAAEWWDPWGPMRPLHKMNPLRAKYVADLILEAFGQSSSDPVIPAKAGIQTRPLDSRWRGNDKLAGRRILDIGCGAGLLSEALAKLGAEVTGIDPADANIDVARAHAVKGGLAIDYRATTAEALPADTPLFDAVLAMEVVEHVADRPLFLRTAANLVRPGGLLILSTLNRTLKSFALAIVGAEYVLRWLPRGTHSWDQFVTPEELTAELRAQNLAIFDRTGVTYNPLFGEWRTSDDCNVNYFLAAEKQLTA